MSECEHFYRDGAGEYCRLIPMDTNKDYPHKHYRVFCYADKDSFACKCKESPNA